MLDVKIDLEGRFRDFQLEVRTIFKDIIRSLKELGFCWQCYGNGEYLEKEIYEREWIDFYVFIRVEEIKRLENKSKESHKEAKEDYIYRFIAYNVVKGKLKDMRISYYDYYEKQPFEKPYEGSFDFVVRTREKGTISLEVVGIPPDYYKPPSEGRYIVKNFIIPEREEKM